MQLIGRRDALETLETLGRDDARFVTILGPPGIGKTTLARAHAARTDGVCRVVILDGVHCVDRAQQAIAASVGLTDGEPTIEELAEHLERIEMRLLILDNLEQLAPEIAPRLNRLLDHCSTVRIVTTSRRRIGAVGEHLVELGPLGPGSDGAAAELFLRRARQLQPDFQHDDEALSSVVEHTAGVPLAIELAAARLRLISLPELARRLGQRRIEASSVSSSGPLSASVATSWQLLATDARRALGALARLPGAFPLSLAEQVTATVATDPLDVVQRLRDDSLISRVDDGLTILPFVREFAISQSVTFERQVVDEAICLSAEGVAVRFLAGGRAADLGALGGYVDALTSVFERAESRLSLRAAESLAVYFMRRGQGTARRRFLRKLNARLEEFDENPTASLCLRMVGVCTRQDAFDDGVAWLDRIDVDASAAAEPVLTAKVAAERAALLNTARRHDEAVAEIEAAIPSLQRAGEQVYVLRAFVSKFVAHYYRGDLPAARTAAREALKFADTFAEPPDYFVAVVLNNLCFLNSILGNAAEARKQGARALEMFELAGDSRAATMVRGYLGLLAMNLDELEAAEGHFEAAATSHRGTGDRLQEAYNLANLAELTALRGDAEQTAMLLRESESVAARVDWPGIEVHNAGVRATLAIGAGDIDAAGRAFTAGVEHAAAPTMPNEYAYFTVYRAVIRRVVGEPWNDDRELAYERRRKVTNPHFLAAFSVLSLGLEEPGTPEFAEQARMASRTLRDGLVDQPTVGESFLVRRAWGFLRDHLTDEARLEVAAWAVDPQATSLCIGADAARFRLPGGEWLDLSRRSTQAAMLCELVESSLADEVRTTDQLFEAVWPGEAAHPESASNRVYNALALLRRNGLSDYVVRQDEGYRLVPGLELLLLDGRTPLEMLDEPSGTGNAQSPGTSN